MIKIFSDGANLKDMLEIYYKVDGYTTNPTLMKKAGITDYHTFAKEVLEWIKDKPISFEVFFDDLFEMENQARLIASWADNIYIKIPITNTKGISTESVIQRLSKSGIKVNVTAILTVEQGITAIRALSHAKTPGIVSVFAGRIADTGRNPENVIKLILNIMSTKPHIELLWASTRELYNIKQAEKCGCHIITVTPEILKKLSMLDKDLNELSLETVQMFYNDARGFTL